MDYFEDNLINLIPQGMVARDEKGDLQAFLKAIGIELDKIADKMYELGLAYDIDNLDEDGLSKLEKFLEIEDLCYGLNLQDRREMVKHGIRIYKIKGTKLCVEYLANILFKPTSIFIEKLYNYEPTGNPWVDELLSIYETRAKSRPDFYSTVAVIIDVFLEQSEEPIEYYHHKFKQYRKALPRFLPEETNLILDMLISFIGKSTIQLKYRDYSFGVPYRICNRFATDEVQGGLLRKNVGITEKVYGFDKLYPICNTFVTSTINVEKSENNVILAKEYRDNEVLFKRVGSTFIGEGDI